METDEGRRARRLSRVAGGFYLLLIFAGMPGMIMLMSIVVAGDSAATASNLHARPAAVWIAFTGYLVSTAAYVVVTGIFYLIFRPVSRAVSLIAAFFSIVGCSLGAASMLFVEAPLIVLGPPHPAALGAAESRDLALLLTQLFFASFDIAMIFFAFYCLLIGWLIVGSGFLPRLLGLALAAGGLGYVTYLWPPLAHSLFPLNVLPGFAAELALSLWLLLAGLDEARWTDRVRCAEPALS